MSKAELEKLKETVAYFGHWYDVIGEERVSILEKSIDYIAELEQQIENMKCCGNCSKYDRNNRVCSRTKFSVIETLCNCTDDWELRR